MAGWEGFEPPLAVLETAALPLNYHPIGKWCPRLLGFAVKRALLFEGAELHELYALSLRLLITCSRVITALALSAGQNREFTGHF